ncbi:MAG TPA: hypothetical protein VKT18_06280, partial [Acidimicrobiales bacterium]|nr:hypothetical protein [Acidimicrobiales bacterium]
GHGLSASADREVATVVAFLVGAGAFLPVVFFNLMAWLRSEDRPLSLSALARDEAGVVASAVRASGRPPSGARPG